MATKDWSVDQVCGFLESINLGHLAPEFKKNAVDGQDLLDLTDQDLQEELNMTSLQVKKVRNAMAVPGLTPPPPNPTITAPPPASTGGSAATNETIAARSADLTAAVGTPVGSTKPIPERFAAEQLAAYRALQSVIQEMELQDYQTKLSTAQRDANDTFSRLEAAKKAIAKATKDVPAAEKEVEDKEGWYIGKIIGGKAKAGEKLSAAEHTLKDAQTRLAESTALAEKLESQLAQQKQTVANLQGSVNDLRAQYAEREMMVNNMFLTPDWTSDPTLTGMQQTIAHLHQQLAENSSHSGVYGRANQCLKSALGKIAQALQALSRLQMLGGMEMMGDMMTPGRRRGGFVNDMAQLAILRQSNELVQRAANDIAIARSILPTLPPVTEALLQEAKTGVFASMLFQGFGGNMMQIAMVKKSMETVRRLEGETRECANWTQNNLSQFSAVVGGLKAQEEGKRVEMENFKKDALAQALAATAVAA